MTQKEQERQAIEIAAAAFAYQQCRALGKNPNCNALDSKPCTTCGVGNPVYSGCIKMADFVLSELQKPSEDLEQELLSMFDSNFDGYLFDDSDNGEPCLSRNKFVDIIPKIAKLLPFSRIQQNSSEPTCVLTGKSAECFIEKADNAKATIDFSEQMKIKEKILNKSKLSENLAKNFVQALKEYLATTPHEEIMQELNKLNELDKVGIPVNMILNGLPESSENGVNMEWQNSAT